MPRQLDGGHSAVVQFGQGGECEGKVDCAFTERQVFVGMRAHVVQLHVGQQRTRLQEGSAHTVRLDHYTVTDVYGHPQIVRVAQLCT